METTKQPTKATTPTGSGGKQMGGSKSKRPLELTSPTSEEGNPMKRRGSLPDLSNIGKIQQCVPGTKFNLSELVFAASTSTDFVSSITKSILTPVIDSVLGELKANISQLVKDAFEPCLEAVEKLTSKINEQAHDLKTIKDDNSRLKATVSEQTTQLNKITDENQGLRSNIDTLFEKIDSMEMQLDEQEQYSRRNCLRFHVPTPVYYGPPTQNGIIAPIFPDTDSVVLDVCQNMLNVKLSPDDIYKSFYAQSPPT